MGVISRLSVSEEVAGVATSIGEDVAEEETEGAALEEEEEEMEEEAQDVKSKTSVDNSVKP